MNHVIFGINAQGEMRWLETIGEADVTDILKDHLESKRWEHVFAVPTQYWGSQEFPANVCG